MQNLPMKSNNGKCYNGRVDEAGGQRPRKEAGTCDGVEQQRELAFTKLVLLTEKQLDFFILSVKEEQHLGVLAPFQVEPDPVQRSSEQALAL